MTTAKLPPPFRTIHFSNMDHLPAFKEIPSGLVTEKGCYFLNRHERTNQIYESRVASSGHMLISVDNHGYDAPSWNPVTGILEMCRYSKAMQAVYLNHFMDGISAKHYRELKTYSENNQFGIPRTVPEGKYVLKPATGARSCGIVYFDSSTMHIREFSNLLDMHINKYERKVSELRERKEKDPSIAEVEQTKTECIQEFFTKHGIEWNKGLEYHTDEAAKYIFDRNLIVQEWNPHAEGSIELRALQCVGVEPLIYERQDLDVDWVGYSKKFSPTDIRPEIYDEILKVLKHPKFPQIYGSVDIWVNNKAKVWGIYEFQPEYCSINIRDEDHRAFMKDVLDGLWNYCFKQ